MTFTDATERKFQVWINKRTWSSRHPLDERRFYDFVDQLYRDHDGEFDDHDLVLRIAGLKSIGDDDSRLRTVIEYVEKALAILRFLKHTGR